MSWLGFFDRRMLPYNITFGMSVVAALVALRRSAASPGAKRFAWWLLLGAVSNLIGRYYWSLGQTNRVVYHWYNLLSVGLLGLAGYRLIATRRVRIAFLTIVGSYGLLWLTLSLTGIDNGRNISRFLDPGELAVGMILGLLLVVLAIREGDQAPLRRADAWLGFGLVLGPGSTLLSGPITAALHESGSSAATTIGLMSTLAYAVALLVWCIPYIRRSIIWTR